MASADDQDQQQTLEQQLQEVSEQLNIDIDWARALRREEILWLLDRCPFLQMVNPHLNLLNPEYELKVVTAQSSGWDIHIYPDAMSSSPGRFLFGGGYFRLGDEDESGGGQIVNPGQGTIVNQAIQTAMEMVQMAVDLGWKGIQVVDAHPLMGRGAWLKAQEKGLEVIGFEPTDQDLRVLERLQRSEAQEHNLREGIKKSM